MISQWGPEFSNPIITTCSPITLMFGSNAMLNTLNRVPSVNFERLVYYNGPHRSFLTTKLASEFIRSWQFACAEWSRCLYRFETVNPPTCKQYLALAGTWYCMTNK